VLSGVVVANLRRSISELVMAVVRVALAAWFLTTLLSTAALLTSTVLPRWVKVDVHSEGKVVEVDVGLWLTCQQQTDSIYSCTALNSSSLTGK